MPVNPQFIPISKKRQMLSVSSWRRPAATDSASESTTRDLQSNNNYTGSTNSTDNNSSSLPSYTPMHEHERSEYTRNDKNRPSRHRSRCYSYSHDETPLPSSYRDDPKSKYGPTRAYHSSKLTYKEHEKSDNFYCDSHDNGNGVKRRFNNNDVNKSKSNNKEYDPTSSESNNNESEEEICDYYVHVNFPHDIDVKEFKEQLCRFICPIKYVEVGHRVNLIDRKNCNNNNNNHQTQSNVAKKAGSAKNNKPTELESSHEQQEENSSSSSAASAESFPITTPAPLPHANMTVLGKTFDIEAFKTPAWTTAVAASASGSQHHATNSSNWHSSSSDPLHDAEVEWAANATNENEWTPGALPPAISLPPAELDVSVQQICKTNKPHTSGDVIRVQDECHTRQITQCNESSMSSSFIREVSNEYNISVLYAERNEAEAAVCFIQKHWPSCLTRITSRDAHTHNCTLVCKNAPNLSAWTCVMNEMTLLNCAPTYYRFLHSEHGSFRGIVYLKYDNRELAESTKMKLELISVSGKPLRVEFKRKAALANSLGNSNNYKKTNSSSNHNHQRPHSNTKLRRNDKYDSREESTFHDVNRPNEMSTCTNNTNKNSEVGSEPIDLRAPLSPSTELHLTKLIRALRTSVENEGVMFARNELTNAEVRVLKQRCLTYGMHFYMDEKQIRVQRPFGGYSVFAHHNTTITESNPSSVNSQTQKNNTSSGGGVNNKFTNSSKNNDTYNRWSSANIRSRAYHSENSSHGDQTYHRPSLDLHALPSTTAAIATNTTTSVTSSLHHTRSASSSSSSPSSSRTTSATSSATSSSANTPAMRYATQTTSNNNNEEEEYSNNNNNNNNDSSTDSNHRHYHHHHHHHHSDDDIESTRTNTSSHVSSSQTNTPAWAPVTPAPFRPMDFKGIRHWRDIQGQHAQLGIIRPLGPDDVLVAFAAGRGRPVERPHAVRYYLH